MPSSSTMPATPLDRGSLRIVLFGAMLGAIACGLLYVLWREVRKIPAKLFTLMASGPLRLKCWNR
jgi:hypothetical protein